MPRKVARTKAFRVVYDPISLEFSLPQTVTVDQLKKQVSMLTGLDTNNFELNGLPSDATGEDTLCTLDLQTMTELNVITKD